MNIKFGKIFGKDVAKIQDKKLLQSLKELIEAIEEIKKISELVNLKKMRNHKNYYRIRIGNYRIGIKVIDTHVEMLRLLHRKDIYKSFP